MKAIVITDRGKNRLNAAMSVQYSYFRDEHMFLNTSEDGISAAVGFCLCRNENY
jgi:hypothetical protein